MRINQIAKNDSLENKLGENKIEIIKGNYFKKVTSHAEFNMIIIILNKYIFIESNRLIKCDTLLELEGNLI